MSRLWQRIVLPAVAGVVLATGTATVAQAATTLTINPAVVHGSDFTWSCVVNAGGGTTYVAGASWITADGSDFVETARTKVTGSVGTTVAFTRDGAANLAYQFRCKAYDAPTGGNLTRSDKLDVTTYGDTRYGLLVSTRNEPDVGDDFTGFVTEYNRHRPLMGDAPLGVRVYSSDDIPLADANGNYASKVLNWVAANHPDESVTVSFKLYAAARLTTLLNWAQANDIALTLIYYHEPQENWAKDHDSAADPAVYKNIYHQMRTLVDAHPWRTHVVLEKCLMWYWQHFNAATLGGDWHDYVESKDANGNKVDPADRVTWDAYNPLNWTRYATPSEFMEHALAVWQATGVGWGYGEIGATPVGTADAAWVAATKAYADAARTPALAGTAYAALPPAQVFKYWCAYQNLKVRSYHLEQNPAAVSMYQGYVTNMPLAG